MYECNKCGKEFKYKYLLKNHNNRKFSCETQDNIDNVFENKIKNIENEIEKNTKLSLEKKDFCFLCNTSLSIKTNIKRHINQYCKIKKKLLEDIEKIKADKINILQKQEIKELREKNLLLKNNKNNSVNNITINNTINNNTINNNIQNNIVVINPFGKEDLSHLSIEDYKKFLNGFFPGFLKYIEKVHFDENAPQNHNICISNLRSKYLTIHDGDKWVTKMKDDILERFINKKHSQLSDKCEYLEETKQIDKKIIDNFEEFCESFNDKEAKKTTKNNIITMIYDNKDKIKN